MKTKHQQDVARIVRKESARLTSALVRYLGSEHLMLAEDVAQDAIVAALSNWSPEHLPDHPGAWLRRVATNRAIDILRRRVREYEWQEDNSTAIDMADLHSVQNPELRLLYLTCNQALPPIDQVILSLNIVAGFSAASIAELLLQKTSAVAQRLVRLKRKLRATNDVTELSKQQLENHLDPLLRAIYLMFCAGYLPASGTRLLRTEILEDALSLAEALFAQTSDGEAAALSALIALQASRSETRQNDDGLVDIASQNREQWSSTLISRGLHHLQASRISEQLSRYHIEAAIAAEHATALTFADTNWAHIEQLYSQLEQSTQSPIVSVSAALANLFAGHLQECEARLNQVAASSIAEQYAPYHATLARLLAAQGKIEQAEQAHIKAQALQKNLTVRAYLKNQYLH